MKKLFLLISLTLIIQLAIFATDQPLPDRSLDMANEMMYVGYKAVADTSNVTELNDLYSHLTNNINWENTDEKTREVVDGLLDEIEALRMLSVKRERLDTIYNLRKAEIIKTAVPNPINLIGTVGMFAVNPVQGLTSLLGTAASSALMYEAANSALNLEMLQQEWELEDAERASINESNTSLVNYASEYSYDYRIPTQKVMNEELITEFIELISVDNNPTSLQRSIRQLEFYQNKYESFPRYWLELADLYYRNGQYVECLNSIETYEINFDYKEVYRENYRYAQILVDGIGSLFELDPNAAVNQTDQIKEWLKIIEDNTRMDDWLQRYFCASIYLIINDEDSLNEAYRLIVDANLTSLAENQDELLLTYINGIPSDSEVIAGYDENQVKELKAYYKELREIRKTELPPLDAAYETNLQMLYAIVRAGITSFNSEQYGYLLDSLVIPQLRAVFEGDSIELSREDFSVRKDLTSSDFTLALPAVMLNDQTTFGIKILNLEDPVTKDQLSKMVFDDVSPIDSVYAKENMGIAVVTKVDRKNAESVNDFVAEIHFDINNDLTKNYNNYGLAILINTADCPLVLYFAGKDPSHMVLVTAVKNYSIPSFYTDFE